MSENVKIVTDQGLVEMAHGLLARIPWSMKAWPLYGYEAQSRVAFLARFLSTMWLAERNINIMSVCCCHDFHISLISF